MGHLRQLVTNSLHSPQGKEKGYFSVDFQLEKPRIFFQLKLRSNESEPMFVIVKHGSKALEYLKDGGVVPMNYHYHDKEISTEKKMTRIKYLFDKTGNGHKDHFMIALEI